MSGLNDVQNEQDITVNDVSSLSCNFYDYTLILNNLWVSAATLKQSSSFVSYSKQIGGWSVEGLTVDKINSNRTSVTCLTRHLTSFAVLVNIQDEKPVRNEVVKYIWGHNLT